MSMKQINFRLSDREYDRLELAASLLDKSIPSIIKEFTLKEIDAAIVEATLELYKKNKVGLKRAWILSGLSFHEFLDLLSERGIEPSIPDSLDDAMIADAKALTFEDVFLGKDKEELKKLIHYYEE
jgi:uncharacterized protein (DUF1778 family)